AEAEAVAEDALLLIDVEYEELPAVFESDEAMKEDAALVHESVLGYAGHWDDLPSIPNVYSFTATARGDIEAGFAESDLIFDHTFTTQSQHHLYLEPHSALVEVDARGGVH